MTYSPTRIPSKGFCIYCGRAELRLTDEHVLPYSIGGHHVIEEASCDDCAKITSKFELDVTRELWGDARIAFNAPSRRKKKRPPYIEVRDANNPSKTLQVPVNEYPAAMVFYRMHSAGILDGFPENLDSSKQWEFTTICDRQKIDRYVEKYGQEPTAKFRHVPDSFARLLAKVAYGQVLCSLDPDDFRPICLPYILGEKKNPSHVVGGRWSYPDIQPGIGYELRTNCVNFLDKLLIVVEIQFLPNCQTPVYHVLVGDVSGTSEVTRVLGKIAATYTVTVADASLYRKPSDDNFHWMPGKWPLPAWQ